MSNNIPKQDVRNAADHLFLMGYRVSEVVKELDRMGFRNANGNKIDRHFVRGLKPEYSVGLSDNKIKREEREDGLPDTPYVEALLIRIEKEKDKIAKEQAIIIKLYNSGVKVKNIVQRMRDRDQNHKSSVSWTKNKVLKSARGEIGVDDLL